ncbi:transcription factor bHLH128 [Andrographis paniculata]|uniref:transcription factor bHLH128 n=1 Tax=Andrographis paniculata TaxID=175694 RepID=UPI0021E85717|nr:transcription factor bHLH128 [Andrographis paniculata]
MFPPPSSSQPPTHGGAALTRYSSAPSALLSTATAAAGSTARELSAAAGFQTHLPSSTALFFPSEINTSDSMEVAGINDAGKSKNSSASAASSFLGGGGGDFSSSSPLVRRNSSPPELINQLATAARNDNHGYSTIIRDMERANRNHIESGMNQGVNFITQHETFSHNPKETNTNYRKSKDSYIDASIGVRAWENTNPITFSMVQSKHDDHSSLNSMESQFQFSLGMPSMENLVNVPKDSIPCKIRAKRGCATHPRSIAERERRTRISGKLKKLHDLVPNMDKQTSYADMLELAVKHITTLQNKVQRLKDEIECCTCGCSNL